MDNVDVGLIVTAIGTILVAIAIGKHKDDPGDYEDDKGRRFPFVYVLKPEFFKTGLGLIIFGTLLQLSFVTELIKPKGHLVTEKQEGMNKELKVGDEFHLKNGRKISIKEVSVGNYYQDNFFGDKAPMRGSISVRVNSDGGPLNEEDYSKMYIVKGDQLIKLSNSKAAYYGEYWFDLPKTNDFEGMTLHFGDEAVIRLTPYIRSNNL